MQAVSRAHPAKRETPAEFERESNAAFSQAKLVCVGIVFLVALFLYSITLAPTVTLVDSGELILAAQCVGVAHPPGFPLWVMLAHLASLVPWGSVAVRVNFASAVFAALACGVFTALMMEAMIVASSLAKKKQGKTPPLLVLGPAVAAGLLLAFSRTHWFYATITEVYTLNTLLIVLVIFFMLRWRRRAMEKTSAIAHNDAWLYTAAVVFGLGLGVHHVTVALFLPGIALLVYRTRGVVFFASKKLLFAALYSTAALVAVYAYLPVAAARGPIFNWGDPSSLTRIWWHVTGRQYQVFLSFTPQIMGRQLGEFGRMALREFASPWIPLALALAAAGLCYAFRRDRTTFWLVALFIGSNLAYGLCYEIAEDKDAYYLPTFVSLAIAAGLGLRWVLEWPWGKLKLARMLPLLLLPAVALAGNWPFNNRSHYFIAHDYVENILGPIAPGGLLLTLDWQVESPMLYAREIEGLRRDVKVVDVNLLRRSWYFDYLKRAYPELVARSQAQVDVFLAELKQWELDPQAYRKSAARTEQIAAAFLELCQALVTNEARVAPVYLTSDLVVVTGGDDKDFTQWLATHYQLVLRGLVFQLSPGGRLEDPGDPPLEMRGLADGTLRFENDDVVKLKVLPVYTRMLVSRGRCLAMLHEHSRAAAAFEQALALDPSLDVARQGLDESRSRRER